MKTVNLKTLNVLTILLGIPFIITAIAGIFLPETYSRDSDSMAVQGIGQDIVNLFIVVPVLFISLFYANKGKKKALLIFGGSLSYILYSYMIYSFGLHFNRFFLCYVATLGLSLYSFIIFMNEIYKLDVEKWFKGTAKKNTGIYFLIVAFIFYVLWLKSVIPAIITDTIPADVSDYGLLVNPVHVLDMGFALPALIIGGINLMKSTRTGYILASLILVFIILLTLALAGMVIMLVVRDIQEDFTIAAVFGAITLTTLLFAWRFFQSLKN